MANTIDLGGRNAVVTGGAQGIGRAIVERLLDSGAAVAIWDRDIRLAEKTAAEVKRNRRVEAVAVDVTRLDEVERARDATVKAFGRIDILVNNAGIAGPNVKTWEYDPAAWAEVMRVNLDSQFYCCRTVVPLMIAQNYGRIVNIASIAGKEGNPNAPAYSASKAGVIALTKSLGKELASYDISVNCVTPAAAKTAIFDQMSQTAHRLHAVENSPRPLCRGGRDRGGRGVLCVRRLLLHHRVRDRHFRWAGDLLIDPAHEQRRQRLIGIALMCGAVLCFALLDAIAKYLAGHMDPLQVAGMRFVERIHHRADVLQSVDAAGAAQDRPARLAVLCAA